MRTADRGCKCIRGRQSPRLVFFANRVGLSGIYGIALLAIDHGIRLWWRNTGSSRLGVGGRQGPQLVVAVQEIGDGARGDRDAAARELAVDLRDAAVLGVAEPAHHRHDVESELMIG